MTFLYILSWLSVIIHICFITLAIAAFLYYLAELVEEYTVITGKVIKYLIFISLGIYVCLFLFEEFPVSMIICGILGQIMHLLILKTFPFFILSYPPFIIAAVLLFINHYLAFQHFSMVYYPFSEVLAYFTTCLWVVPFTFFVSLSANENVLPTLVETRHLLSDDNDVVSNYFSRKSKRYGLLSLFNYAKESVLPQRVKKEASGNISRRLNFTLTSYLPVPMHFFDRRKISDITNLLKSPRIDYLANLFIISHIWRSCEELFHNFIITSKMADLGRVRNNSNLANTDKLSLGQCLLLEEDVGRMDKNGRVTDTRQERHYENQAADSRAGLGGPCGHVPLNVQES